MFTKLLLIISLLISVSCASKKPCDQKCQDQRKIEQMLQFVGRDFKR